MSEWVKYQKTTYKCGTCENMYWLRADHAHLVKAVSVDPANEPEGLGFRFPFPHEDHLTPLQIAPWSPMDDPLLKMRHGVVGSLPVTGVSGGMFDEVEHCEDCKNPAEPGLIEIRRQRCIDGKLLLVWGRPCCWEEARCVTLEDAQPVMDALLRMSDEAESEYLAEYYKEVARRIEAGYTEGFPNPASLPKRRRKWGVGLRVEQLQLAFA